MKKIFFIFDKTKKANHTKKEIFKKFKNYSLSKSDFIVVGGGDGFMLHILKKYYKYKKPFYGINCGTYGFLMNKFNILNFKKNIFKAKKIFIKPLEVEIKTLNKKKYTTIAINEVSLLRQSKQTAQLKLRVNNTTLLDKLIGDGVLVCTPAGSTAYNLSVNGPIMSLDSKYLAITPISPFRPRRWKGKMIIDKKKIYVANLDPKKRPVATLADNVEIRNTKSVKIQVSKKNSICLLYDRNKSLDQRIKLEQFIRSKKN